MRYRRVINHHKLQRTVTRNIKRSHRLINFILGRNNKRHDFSWDGRHGNPYIVEEKKFSRTKINVIIILTSIIVTIFTAIYSNYFAISDITILGNQRISHSELRIATQGIINYKFLNIIPERSFFLVNTDEIADILKARFPIQTIVVTKQFPNNLEIIIEEKISTLIYDNSDTYSYVGLNGQIVEVVQKVGPHEWLEKIENTTSTNEFGEIVEEKKVIERSHVLDTASVVNTLGDYPIVYDMRHKSVEINTQVMDPMYVSKIIEWYNRLGRSTSVPLKYFTLLNDGGEVTIFTREGWNIKTLLNNEIVTQLQTLETLFKEQVDRSKVHYIDLRYPDRVYWQ